MAQQAQQIHEAVAMGVLRQPHILETARLFFRKNTRQKVNLPRGLAYAISLKCAS